MKSNQGQSQNNPSLGARLFSYYSRMSLRESIPLIFSSSSGCQYLLSKLTFEGLKPIFERIPTGYAMYHSHRCMKKL